MTERLDRIEAILANLAEQQAETRQTIAEGFAEVKAITESNARAIEANSQDIARVQAITESNARAIEANSRERVDAFAQSRQENRAAVEDVVSMITSMSEESAQEWQQVREMQQETRRQIREMQQETSRQVQNLIEEGRADRQANARQHQAFTESIQRMLSEIVSIWQRLAS